MRALLGSRFSAPHLVPAPTTGPVRRGYHAVTVPARSAEQQASFSRARVVVVRAAAQKMSELPSSLQKIVGAFQMVPDPMARYKQLLFYATKLEKLPDELHTPANKVEGCVSQVWVVPELRVDGRVYWRADSDSQLTKGLAALLVNGLSGCTPEEILKVQPDFIEMLGLKQSLTPSRNNGFLNMLRLMQRKTLELAAAQAASGSSAGAATASGSAAGSSGASTGPASSNGGGNGDGSNGHSNGSGSAPSTSRTPVQDGIRRKLTEALKPTKLVIEDQSAQHAGHAAMRAATAAGKAGSSGETHFRVEVVSDAFTGQNLVQRQRTIYKMLEAEFAMGLHALSLDTKTPAEVEATART